MEMVKSTIGWHDKLNIHIYIYKNVQMVHLVRIHDDETNKHKICGIARLDKQS